MFLRLSKSSRRSTVTFFMLITVSLLITLSTNFLLQFFSKLLYLTPIWIDWCFKKYMLKKEWKDRNVLQCLDTTILLKKYAISVRNWFMSRYFCMLFFFSGRNLNSWQQAQEGLKNQFVFFILGGKIYSAVGSEQSRIHLQTTQKYHWIKIGYWVIIFKISNYTQFFAHTKKYVVNFLVNLFTSAILNVQICFNKDK